MQIRIICVQILFSLSSKFNNSFVLFHIHFNVNRADITLFGARGESGLAAEHLYFDVLQLTIVKLSILFFL